MGAGKVSTYIIFSTWDVTFQGHWKLKWQNLHPKYSRTSVNFENCLVVCWSEEWTRMAEGWVDSRAYFEVTLLVERGRILLRNSLGLCIGFSSSHQWVNSQQRNSKTVYNQGRRRGPNHLSELADRPFQVLRVDKFTHLNRKFLILADLLLPCFQLSQQLFSIKIQQKGRKHFRYVCFKQRYRCNNLLDIHL